jgi:hypothetical protein
MEIFDRLYYPEELSDWWMDNWITSVYGEARTRKMEAVEVIHHTAGTRYDVDRAHYKVLQTLVEKGQQRIEAWRKVHLRTKENGN